MTPTRIATHGLLTAAAMLACRGSAPRTAPQSARAAPTAFASTSGTAGDTSLFESRIARVTRNPAQLSFHLDRPAYVTVISVDDKTIDAIAPRAGARSELVGRGSHIASLVHGMNAEFESQAMRPGRNTNPPDDVVSAAAVMEYNRCVANARQMDAQRRSGPRRIIGRDSSGAPIYGPPEETADDALRSLQDRCRMPTVGISQTTVDYALPKPGRFLVLFASDTPIEQVDIAKLVVTAANIMATVQTIGDRLFTVRNSRWSASYVAW